MKTINDFILENKQVPKNGIILYCTGDLENGNGDALKFKNFNELIKNSWNDNYVLSEYFKDENDLKSQLEKSDIDHQIKTGDSYCDIRIFKI